MAISAFQRPWRLGLKDIGLGDIGVRLHRLKNSCFFQEWAFFLASYIGVWKRHLYGLVKGVCVFLEAYIGIWKRLYMSVSKRLHMDVSKRLPMGVSKRLHMGVSKRHP